MSVQNVRSFIENSTSLRIINLTPHDVHVYDESGTVLIKTYPKSGTEARVLEKNRLMNLMNIEGIPIVTKEFCQASPLPDGYDVYIVSLVAAQAYAKDYSHFIVFPDSGPESVVRDEKGAIKGVKRFASLI